VAARVAVAEGSLPVTVVAAAMDAVITSSQALRDVSAALAADSRALVHGAPPAVGRLVIVLIARGSVTLAVRALRQGWLAADRHRRRRDVRPLPAPRAGRRMRGLREGQARGMARRGGRVLCETCRRHVRGWRRCGICGKTASIALRVRGGQPDVCVNCYQLPRAVCSGCGRERPCNFAAAGHPVCAACSPPGRGAMRPLWSQPATDSPLARGAGMRPVLQRGAAQPRAMRPLRRGPAAGSPARHGR
jgi:hypothetical protein